MLLTSPSRFEDRESSPKRWCAIFKAKDGQQWWLTLSLTKKQNTQVSSASKMPLHNAETSEAKECLDEALPTSPQFEPDTFS